MGWCLLPWVGWTPVFILRRKYDDPVGSGGLTSWPKEKGAGTYLSHHLGEVSTVPGRQPKERASAGVQRRAVAHDQDDAHCREKHTSGSEEAQRVPFIRTRVRSATGGNHFVVHKA